MTQDVPRATKPLFTAHWDADLYPPDSRPIVEELVLHILLHGEVLIKDVDLLLNPTIRGALSERGVRTRFKSLLETGRVKVLLPPRETTRFDVDPTEHPLTAVAEERHNKRPHKFRMWRFTEPYRRYCAELDPILRETRAVRFRAAYPKTNDFAATLYRILDDQSWRRREEFRGIEKMVDRFAEYCLDPSLAVQDLRDESVEPFATEFYRSIAYQCVCLKRFGSSWRRQRSMRSLLQSVYAYCEMTREQAISTYYGESLAELPAPRDWSNTTDLSELGMTSPNVRMKIPVAANIDEILNNVIRDCPRVSEVWAISERSVANLQPSVSSEEVCASIAEAFAVHSVMAEKVPWSPQAEERWNSIELIHRVIFLINVIGLVCGVALVKDYEGPIITAEAVALFAKPIMNALRTGQAYDELDTKRDSVRRIIFDSLRSGSV